MTELVFMVEEQSIAELIKGLRGRIIPEGVFVQIITHDGKKDLEQSIPRKLRGWNRPNARFLILRDNDGSNCHELKARLQQLCELGGRPDSVVRIVCQELEAWFLGDLAAVSAAGLGPSRIASMQARAKYREPDVLNNAKQELVKIASEYQPIRGAREIAPFMDIESNRSSSFHMFLSGIGKSLE